MARCPQRGQGGCCRGTRKPAAAAELVQPAQEEMSVHRYVHTIPIRDCDCVSQMEELCQILDYQNRILVELLETLRRCGGCGR